MSAVMGAALYVTRLTSWTLAEFAGTLVGFDDYVNMVLEDVTEL